MTPLRSAAALAALAALPLAAARSRFFEYAPPAQLPVGVSAAPPLKATVLPQAYADSFGAKCLDGTPPAFYSLVQDPSKWVLFLEGGELRTRLAPLPPNALVD